MEFTYRYAPKKWLVNGDLSAIQHGHTVKVVFDRMDEGLASPKR